MLDPKLSQQDEKALQDMIDRGMLPGHKLENGRLICPQQDGHGRRYITEEEMSVRRERILKTRFEP